MLQYVDVLDLKIFSGFLVPIPLDHPLHGLTKFLASDVVLLFGILFAKGAEEINRISSFFHFDKSPKHIHNKYIHFGHLSCFYAPL